MPGARRPPGVLMAMALAAVALAIHPVSLAGSGIGVNADRAQLRPDNPVGALGVGTILVATRRVSDPMFARTVIVLFAHADGGAGGLIVNRPTRVRVEQALPDLSAPGAASHVFLGGPVEPRDIRALLRAPAGVGNSRQVLPGVHLLLNRVAVDEAAASGISADRFRVFAGYAGWGPGQLEREIRRGDWHVFEGDSDVVFDRDPDTLWDRQIRLTEALAV